MESRKALKRKQKSQAHYVLYELFTDIAKLRDNTHPNSNEKELFKIIERDLEVLEIIKKLCKKEDNYLDTDFHGKLYIDGCIEYENEEQKKLVKEWLENDK